MEPASAPRLRVAIVTKDRFRWGLAAISLLLGDYPDDAQDVRIVVEVEDTALGLRWAIPAFTIGRARRIRDRVRETAARLSGAEIDEWSRTGRWPSLRR